VVARNVCVVYAKSAASGPILVRGAGAAQAFLFQVPKLSHLSAMGDSVAANVAPSAEGRQKFGFQLGGLGASSRKKGAVVPPPSGRHFEVDDRTVSVCVNIKMHLFLWHSLTPSCLTLSFHLHPRTVPAWPYLPHTSLESNRLYSAWGWCGVYPLVCASVRVRVSERVCLMPRIEISPL
jgi:hypothetical protein